MQDFKKLLDAECGYRMKPETMERFTGLMTEFELKRGKAVIPYGESDNNVYVVREGIVRIAYFNGFKEKTFGQPKRQACQTAKPALRAELRGFDEQKVTIHSLKFSAY